MYSLIVVDYNSIDVTIEYLARCWEAMGEKGASHAVIVENGSNEGVPEKLAAAYGAATELTLTRVDQKVYRYTAGARQILYCHSGNNLGYAYGNNLGICIAGEVFGDAFCIVSNNDLYFETPLDLAVADRLFANDPTIAVIGPAVTTPEGLRQSPNCFQTAFQRLFLFYWKPLLRLFGKKEPPRSTQTGPCDWVIGCFMLIRMDAIEKAGMFDEKTFLYAEELILTRRLEKLGYQVWYCHQLSVVHKHAQTTKKALSMLQTKQINFDSILYYYKAYVGTSSFVLTLAKINFFIHKTLYLCAQSIKSLFRRKTGR